MRASKPDFLCWFQAMSVIGDRRSREQKAKQERWEPHSYSPELKQTDNVWTLSPCFSFCREKELAKVTIKKEDVELIVSATLYFIHILKNIYMNKALMLFFFLIGQMSEMEISRAVAERSLREHLGNVVEALVALTNWLRTSLYWTASFIIVIVFYSVITPSPIFLILK